MLQDLGRWLIWISLGLLLVGLLLFAFGRFIGRLPGDVTIDRPNLRVFIPCGTMILLSLLLTLILNVIVRLRR